MVERLIDVAELDVVGINFRHGLTPDVWRCWRRAPASSTVPTKNCNRREKE
ncbi:MAG: hypothetical protein H5T84_02830 [Thermoleophilia bacterium]|nr:hypothetical protein [Thermoleophilia bacterium]